MTEQSPPRLIKKYPNRRLYDTQTSSHVTLGDIRQFVIDGISFQIVDAKTGEDLTRSVLMQIIQEAESDGEPIFSSDMLRNIIRFYGPYQTMLGSYLEKNIQTIIDIQTQTGAKSSEAWGEFLHKQVPVMQDLMGQYVDQSRDLFISTQKMFDLFGGAMSGNSKSSDKKNGDKD